MNEEKNPQWTPPSKLRTLVYAGLAGGIVGVTSMSAAAHGNASPCTDSGVQLSWQADDFVVVDAVTEPEAK